MESCLNCLLYELVNTEGVKEGGGGGVGEGGGGRVSCI
jgi:hypothetical protein